MKLLDEIDNLLKTVTIQHLGAALRKKNFGYIKHSLLRQFPFVTNQNISECVYCLKNNIREIPMCQVCNKKKTKFISFTKGYTCYCGRQCLGKSVEVRKKMKKTCLLKYGVSNPMKSDEVKGKYKKNMLEKYGIKDSVEYQERRSEIESKMKKTCLLKYGVSNPMKSDKIKGRYKKNHLLKYGVNNPMKRKEVGEKNKKTCLKKYNVPFYSSSEEYKEKREKYKFKKRESQLYDKYMSYINEYFTHEISIEVFKENFIEGPYRLKCKKCKKISRDSFIFSHSNVRFARCHNCNPFPTIGTQKETEIGNYLAVLSEGVDIRFNTRKIISPLELDFYIPSLNLAIEYNGLMFHSFGKSKHSMFDNYLIENECKYKHLTKTNECEERGIHLLHINENEWINPIKKDIWKSILSTKFGKNKRIYARKTKIREITTREKNTFLVGNHLQGKDNSKIKLGLYFEDELISIMTFGKSRYNKKASWELYRFANKKFTSITGGASKLFKYFYKKYMSPDEILISYADRRYSMGNLYEKLGFYKAHETKPNYKYFKEDNILSIKDRQTYQKHKLNGILNTFNAELTESENMYNNGYRKIYDCGNLVYLFNKKKGLK